MSEAPRADAVSVLVDLTAESDELDAVVADLTEAQWTLDTPAPGWTVADQIGHLVWTDEVSLVAATDADAFTSALAAMAAEMGTYVDRMAAERAAWPRPDLLVAWRDGRRRLVDALAAVPSGLKLPWFGPPMGAVSMATARLMETWAHGQDVVDALGVVRAPTDRLRHIAHIGVRTRDFAYLLNGRPVPEAPVRVELVAPSGTVWAWGPEDATQHVAGPALDFCLLVTQRRHRDDLTLIASGDAADEWLGIAQAFAGPPGGGGRTPGQFAHLEQQIQS
jgi:uncharacterized protein (TIGR03084 family)